MCLHPLLPSGTSDKQGEALRDYPNKTKKKLWKYKMGLVKKKKQKQPVPWIFEGVVCNSNPPRGVPKYFTFIIYGASQISPNLNQTYCDNSLSTASSDRFMNFLNTHTISIPSRKITTVSHVWKCHWLCWKMEVCFQMFWWNILSRQLDYCSGYLTCTNAIDCSVLPAFVGQLVFCREKSDCENDGRNTQPFSPLIENKSSVG